ISSWVLRSRARSESIWDNQAFWASWSAGATAWRCFSKGKFQSWASVMSLTSSCYGCASRTEDRKSHLVGLGPEDDLEVHTDLQLVERAVDHVGHHAGPLLQFDDRRDIG